MAVTALVIDDGSRPDQEAKQRLAVETASAVLTAAHTPHQIQYHRARRNQGKGASIRWGWSLADPACRWLSFVDADGAIDAREYWRLVDQLPGATVDALCGARVNMLGRSVNRSLFRHLQGRSFATVVELLFHLGFYDTQCGIKFFRAERLRPFLGRLRENRWLLDIELLAWLKTVNARCIETPIDCHERGGSALVFGLDPIRMLFGLLALRSRLRGTGGAR
jgi:hypothetical protein